MLPSFFLFLFNKNLSFFSSVETELGVTFAFQNFDMISEEEIGIEKERLVEQLGVFMENEAQLAPMAARILSTLILVGKEGSTFDQLVNDLKASKSTISTHLENLQTTNKIKYYTKPGDRKRYFIINQNLMMNIIDDLLIRWQTEKEIHQAVLEYKKKMNELQDKTKPLHFDLEFQKDFLVFLEEATTAIQKLKSNIINNKHLTNYNNQAQ